MAGQATQGWSRKAFRILPRPCPEIRRLLIDSFLGSTLLAPTGSAFCWARPTKSNRNISNATWPNSIAGSTAGDQSVSPPRAGLSHNPHGYLQRVNHRAGSSLISSKNNPPTTHLSADFPLADQLKTDRLLAIRAFSTLLS